MSVPALQQPEAAAAQTASPTGHRAYDHLDSDRLSNSNHIDSLLSAYKWQQEPGTTSTVLTYSLVGLGTSWYATDYPDTDGDSLGPQNDGLQALNSFEMAQVRLALSKWSNVANITFVEVTDSQTVAGDLRFAYTDDAPTAYAYYPGGESWAGDVWLGDSPNNHNPQLHSYGFGTIIHEIGHALGLKHPHEGANSFNLGPAATAENDALLYTIMSYRDYVGDNIDGVRGFNQPITPMVNDIAAIQWLYGANTTYNSGDTVYHYAGYSEIFETIWDGGGNDTISWQGRSEAAEIDLTPGSYSKLGPGYAMEDWQQETRTLGIAYDAWIEKAIGGSGNDILRGNAIDNVLDGGTGIDTLSGGFGDDIFYVNSSSDVVYEGSYEGEDIIYSSAATYTLTSFIETLTLTGAAESGYGNEYANTVNGNSNANSLFGEGDSDTLSGAGGNDLLNGGWGTDDLYGGTGDDVYYTDGFDNLHEFAGEGTDTILSTASTAVLGAWFENLWLLESAHEGTGNSQANHIHGNAYENTLDGAAGADTLEGGDGDDTYYIENAGDVVIEGTDAGADTVHIRGGGLFYTLAAGVETLILDAGAPLGGQYRGNALDNSIQGNADGNNLYGEDGNDKLIGGGQADNLFGGTGDDLLDGGVGGDVMRGGDGNDSYMVDDTFDQVIETGANPNDIDIVYSGLTTYTLTDNVENLSLSSWFLQNGTNGTGNALANTITGNEDGNVLEGGAGDDMLYGGGHDDVLRGQDDDDYLYGEAGDDSLLGGDGDDLLDGGAGNDTMRGGVGDDTYYVSEAGDAADEGGNTDSFDRVVSSLTTYALGAGIEGLTLLTGAAAGWGNGLDNFITGNEDGNALAGYDGSDVLFGSGGDDKLNGGEGDDILDGGEGADELFGGDGFDTADYSSALSAVAIDLTDLSISLGDAEGDTHSSIESVSGSRYGDLLSGDSAGNSFYGNDGGDVILGWSGDDTLMGAGGADTFGGSAGDDRIDGGYGYADMAGYTGLRSDYTIVQGHDGSIVIRDDRLDGDGEDIVTGVEVFQFMDGLVGLDRIFGGDHPQTTIIGSYDDHHLPFHEVTINGSSGADMLGAVGANFLYGLEGDDTYFIDHAADVIIESGKGIDTILTSVSYVLSPKAAVEILRTIDAAAKTAINLTGSSVGNKIYGNAGANKLNGKGGSDEHTGGKGKDTFIFDTALNAKTNLDKVFDFNAKDDTIWLENKVFKSLKKTGTLAKGALQFDKAAKDADDRILYHKATGSLSYDPDGTGSAKAVMFALLKNKPMLTNADFYVI